MPTPPGNATKSTFQIGTWTQQTDTFTSVLDLNDQSTWWIEHGGLKFPQPEKVFVRGFNIRSRGEQITRYQYKNRHIQVSLRTKGSNAAAILTAVHSLLAAIESPPYAIRIALPGAAVYKYADVVAVTHNIPSDTMQMLQAAQTGIQIDFECQPGLRRDRVVLQNQVPNPSATMGAQNGVTVFNDTLANLNAYQSPWLAAAQADSPVSLWKMNETSGTVMHDAISTNNGTIYTGVTINQTFNGEAAFSPGAYLYNGSTGKVQVFYTAALNTSHWTIEAWVQPTGGAGTTREILDNANSNTGINLLITSGNQFNCNVGTGSGSSVVQGGTATLNTWSHVAVTYDGTTLTLYVNGSSVNATTTAFAANTTADWWFGTTPGGGSFLPGYIGPVAYYNTPLSATRIAAHATNVVSSSGTLGQDTFRYPDAVLAQGTPARYYRCDESSGTLARDAMFSGNNVTWTGSPTLNATGLLTGDTDSAVTLNGTTQYGTAPITGMPNGSAAWTITAIINPSSLPASTQIIAYFGAWGTATGYAQLGINSSKQVFGGVGSGGTNPNPATVLATGTKYFVAVTYAGGSGGSTVCYVQANGGSMASASNTNTATLPASATTNIVGIGGSNLGSGQTPANFFAGTVDEVCFYPTALNGTQIQTLATQAFTTPTTTSNTMAIPAGMQVNFGSPAWTALNPWQVRWRWLTGLTAKCYLHYVDSNNYILCQMQSSTLSLSQVVAGVSTTIATNGSVALTNGMQYWLQITQFPSTANMFPQFSVSLLADGGGSPGNSVVTLTGAAQSFTAITGMMALSCSGATLGIGGNYSNVNQVNLWGPDGWSFTSEYTVGSPPTGNTAGAWEQTAANCYGGGAIAALCAFRMDCPPAGTVNAVYVSGFSGNSALLVQYGIPATQGQVIGASAWVKTSSLLSAFGRVAIGFMEYNSSGAQVGLSGNETAFLNGPQTSWTQLSGTYTVAQSTAAYVLMFLQVVDTATAGESANATVWFDNVQAWNQTTVQAIAPSQTSMPYIEGRFNQAPAQINLTGLVGDIASPAQMQVGVLLKNAWSSGNWTLDLARRGSVNGSTQLITGPNANAAVATAIADTSSYQGWYLSQNASWSSGNPLVQTPNAPLGQLAGLFHAISRLQVTGAGSPTAVAVNAYAIYNANAASYPTVTPFAGNGSWTTVDTGYTPLVYTKFNSILDQSSATATQARMALVADSSSKTTLSNYLALLPTEAEWMRVIASNGNTTYAANTWFHIYADGVNGSTTYTADSNVATNAINANAGNGNAVGAVMTPLSDVYPYVDPSLIGNNGLSLNQLLLHVVDWSNRIVPVSVEVIYSPCDLYP